jgi:Helix-turn-helix domain
MAVIELSSAGRRALEGIVARAKDVRQYRRAQALLWLAEGERPTAVAQRLRVHRDTVYAWAARYRQRGRQRLPARLAGVAPGGSALPPSDLGKIRRSAGKRSLFAP